jgi:hypothetical protein
MAITISPLDSVAYASATWDDINEDSFSAGYTTSACVVKGRLGANKNLKVAGVSSPVTVEPGVCYVIGKRVYNSASINVSIATPATNPRIDRVIVKYVFATGVVTIERLAGTEDPAPTAPALTQIDGNQYEVSLAQVRITTGGVITVTNERRWARPLGIFMQSEVKWMPATLGGTGTKHPIDPELGSADEDWALADGSTYNGVVTLDLRGRMLIGQNGSTYVQGTTYGATTVNSAHVHPQTVHLHAQTVHLHAVSINSGIANTDLPLYGSGGPTLVALYTPISHYHLVAGNTGNSSAVNTGNSAAVDTGSGGSTTLSILSPCLAMAAFQYCPAI